MIPHLRGRSDLPTYEENPRSSRKRERSRPREREEDISRAAKRSFIQEEEEKGNGVSSYFSPPSSSSSSSSSALIPRNSLVQRRTLDRTERNVNYSDLVASIQPPASANDLKYFQNAKRIYNSICKEGFKSNLAHFTSLFLVFFYANNYEQAKRIYEELLREGIQPDQRMCNLMVRVLVNLDDGDGLNALVETMEKKKFQVPILAYHKLIPRASQDNNANEVVKIFKKMYASGLKPGLQDFTSLFFIYYREENFEQARRVYKNLLHEGIQPDKRICDIMVKVLVILKDSEELFVLIDNMEKRDFPVELLSYNKLIDFFVKEEKNDRAVEVYEKVKKVFGKGNEYTYTLLIQMYIDSYEYRKGLKLLVEMKNAGIISDLRAFNVIIHLLILIGDEQAAYEILDTMPAGIEPDVYTLNILLKPLVQRGEGKNALQLVNKIRTKGVEPDIYTMNSVIEAFASSKPPERDLALEVFEGMKGGEAPPNEVTFNLLIKMFAALKDKAGAIAIFNEMAVMEIKPNARTFAYLFLLFVELKDTRAVQEYLKKMHEAEITLHKLTYTALVNLHIELKDVDAAAEIIEDMISSGVMPDIKTYNLLFDLCAEQKNGQKAFQILNKMNNEIKFDIATFNIFLKLYIESGEYDRALMTLKLMEEVECAKSATTFALLIELYEKQKNTASAFELLEEMRLAGYERTISHYNRILGVFLVQEDKMGAYDVLERIQKAGLVPDERTNELHEKIENK